MGLKIHTILLYLLLIWTVDGSQHQCSSSNSSLSPWSTLADYMTKMNELTRGFTSLSHSLSSMASLLQLDLARQSLGQCGDTSSDCTTTSNTTELKAILQDIVWFMNHSSLQLNTLTKTIEGHGIQINSLNKTVDSLKKSLQKCWRPKSCLDIKTAWPYSTSGIYSIYDESNNGSSHSVYCHMEKLCSSEGGWTRIAYLNMSDSLTDCPPGFRQYESGGVRVCGRQNSSSGSCQSVKFSSYGISYSQVCGRVVGYQYATPDAIDTVYGTGHNDINSHYVDGISLTRGSPRQHIWTFMAGLYDNVQNLYYNCPCTKGSTQTVQNFVGNDYFCESGCPDTLVHPKLYTTDPLWDKKGCSKIEESCCQVTGLPWFHKIIQSPTTDYIEMRVCGDEGTGNEDVPVNYYEIYIK